VGTGDRRRRRRLPGRQEAPPELLQFLAEQAKIPNWVALVTVLRRVLAGERGETLLNGLDATDAAVARETLAPLNQEP
jgi:hypothetical protein